MAGESKTQSAMLRDIKSFGTLIYGFKTIKTNTIGTPDVTFYSAYTGYVVVECKTEGAKPRESQVVQLKKAHNVGVKAFSVDSVRDWILLKKYLGLTMENLKKAQATLDLSIEEYNHFKHRE